MNKLEIIDESTLSVNPFTYSLSIRVSRGTSLSKYKFDSGGDRIMINDVFYYDRQQSTRLYHSRDNEEVISMLSPTSLRLFYFIANRMVKQRDWVQINKEYFMSKYGVKSINSFKDALKELQRYLVIVGTHYDTVYWVNPSFMFNGDRIKKYPSNLNVVSEIITK
jgi:hypothetical protein